MDNCINVDGIIVNADGTIRDVLERAGIKEEPASVVTNCAEVITPEDYGRPAPPTGMNTNASAIIKGASVRSRLLALECLLIARLFLSRYPGTRRTIEVTENRLYIRSFPLPGGFTPDSVDLLIVTWGYPEIPPAAIHVPAHAPNRLQIEERLKGHMFGQVPESLRGHVEELTEYGYAWCCFHYKDWSWKLNPKNLLSGDCILKFCMSVFAALSGGYR